MLALRFILILPAAWCPKLDAVLAGVEWRRTITSPLLAHDTPVHTSQQSPHNAVLSYSDCAPLQPSNLFPQHGSQRVSLHFVVVLSTVPKRGYLALVIIQSPPVRVQAVFFQVVEAILSSNLSLQRVGYPICIPLPCILQQWCLQQRNGSLKWLAVCPQAPLQKGLYCLYAHPDALNVAQWGQQVAYVLEVWSGGFVTVPRLKSGVLPYPMICPVFFFVPQFSATPPTTP